MPLSERYDRNDYAISEALGHHFAWLCAEDECADGQVQAPLKANDLGDPTLPGYITVDVTFADGTATRGIAGGGIDGLASLDDLYDMYLYHDGVVWVFCVDSESCIQDFPSDTEFYEVYESLLPMQVCAPLGQVFGRGLPDVTFTVDVQGNVTEHGVARDRADSNSRRAGGGSSRGKVAPDSTAGSLASTDSTRQRQATGKPSTAAGTSALPPEILADISWAFRGDPFTERETFDATVRSWQDGFDDAWRPDDILLCPAIRVSYFGLAVAEDAEYTQYVVELTSDNGKHFTTSELLYKLHNAVVARLRDADHNFFEGLILKEAPTDGGGPLYEMRQGS